MEITEIVLRFLVTFLLSSLFGLERQRSHKPVGFGTFIFVAISACALAISAIMLYPENSLPLMSAIVTGTGFLGAGALIRTTNKIFGFTTAASIWAFAIFGLIIGSGNYSIGIILYSLLWIVILIDKHLENKGIGSYQRKIVINTNKIIASKEIEDMLHPGIKNHRLLTIDVNKRNNTYSFVYLIEGSKDEINNNLRHLFNKEWCDSIKVE